MCKLFAWQGNEIRNVEKLIKGLLVAETLKNPHGTGIFVVSKSGKKKLLKRGYDAVSLLIRDAENLSYTLHDAKFVMGHVRYATHGSPKKRNSHPFVFTRVVGCHNGVLNYDELVCLAKEEKIKKLDEVDSKLFFRILNYYLKKYSFVESLKKILKRVSGDYTFLIYYNDELYFIRNSGRPLFLFDMRNKGMGVFLASTEEMWKKACNFAGSFAGIKNQAVEVKPDVLYKLSSEGELVEVAKIKGKKKEKRNVKQFSYNYYFPAYNGYYDYYRDEFEFEFEDAEKKSKKKAKI